MSTIPELRQRLYLIAIELGHIADELERRPSRKKAPRSSVPMTPDLAERIRNFASHHPEWTENDIGIHFGVNQGRVSESLRGKRE